MANYVFYDDETQGAAQLICQVGFVVTDTKGQVISTHQTLVNPHHDFDWYVIRHIHHITPNRVRNAPDFTQVWAHQMLPILEDGVLVAHGARSADLHHIEKSLKAYGIAMPQIDYVDTMDMAKELFPKGPWKLAKLAEHYGIEDPSHHDALNDAEVLREVFARMLDAGAKPIVQSTAKTEAR